MKINSLIGEERNESTRKPSETELISHLVSRSISVEEENMAVECKSPVRVMSHSNC